MSIDRQAMQVDIVKRSESGMIINPYTLPETATLREATNLMNRFRVSGVPIVDGDGRLVGIITNRDLQFERSLDRPVAEAMTKNLITAPQGTTLDEAERILGKHRIEKLPVVDERWAAEGPDHRQGHPQAPPVSRARTRTRSAACASRRRSARVATSSRARRR